MIFPPGQDVLANGVPGVLSSNGEKCGRKTVRSDGIVFFAFYKNLGTIKVSVRMWIAVILIQF